MSEFPYRERLYACMHPETYKYFFHRDAVGSTWNLLQERYGAIRHNEAFHVMEIEAEWFLFRSTRLGNPITVIRKRGCKTEHVAELHVLIGFAP